MPLIRVSMFPGRNASQKAELVRRLSEVFAETCGTPGHSTAGVWVILDEVPESHWGVGGRLSEE
jgi:4-oxalocrotonate tautomerase family enzyme